MLSASMGDRIGRKRVFMTGLVIFTAGSLLCSVAPDTKTLIIFRIVQAVGGSMLNPVAMSIIINTFTDPKERAKAIGVWVAWSDSASHSARLSGAHWLTALDGDRSSG